MILRKSEAEWQGDVKSGHGTVKFGSGAYEGPYSFRSRFESGTGTNPEELIAAAHAGCFSMALSAVLSAAGTPPARIHTTATVRLDSIPGGFEIKHIQLETEAAVPGLDEAGFFAHAMTAKVNCPVSKVLAGATIELSAKLVQG